MSEHTLFSGFRNGSKMQILFSKASKSVCKIFLKGVSPFRAPMVLGKRSKPQGGLP
jgi:hypothetical protein